MPALEPISNLTLIAQLDDTCKKCPNIGQFVYCVGCSTELHRNSLITAEQLKMNQFLDKEKGPDAATSDPFPGAPMRAAIRKITYDKYTTA